MERSTAKINIPNILTIIRILLTPFFVILLLKNMFPFALLIFFVAAVSDGLDGLLARYFNQQTVLGAYLDPIADKLLLMASYISLAVLKIIPPWLTVIVISRDVLITTGIAVLSITNIKFDIKPTLDSKITTTLQLITILYILLDPAFPAAGQVKSALLWITAGLTTLSGLHYIYIGMNILQDALGNNQSTK